MPVEIGYKEEKGKKKLKTNVAIEERQAQAVFSDPAGRPKIGLRKLTLLGLKVDRVWQSLDRNSIC